ncbi:MAG: glycoside hydrolase family 5 protein, partial [Lachnospiraceae bacterium]|nr:glycoside hydrolase family 5 protein [Lachnospiraceae bacterium]
NAEIYVENFLDNCDLYGYVPMLWDCSNLFDRRQIKMVDEEMAAIYQEHKYANQSQTPAEELQAAAQADMDAALANASDGFVLSEDKAVAWIMYNSSDWGTLYSVGDVYDPGSKTAGVVATDVEVTGEGTYTVALDFTGTAAGYANSVVFSAVAVGNGELLFPGYIMNITEVLINGEPYKLTGRPYTSSDDQKCTRVNLYNEWVTELPEEIRVMGGGTTGCSPCVLDAATLGNVETIEVTFTYKPGN